jgi:hypothetical protein
MIYSRLIKETKFRRDRKTNLQIIWYAPQATQSNQKAVSSKDAGYGYFSL